MSGMAVSRLREDATSGRLRRIRTFELEGAGGKMSVRLREPSAALALRISEQGSALPDDDLRGLVLYQAAMVAACWLEDHGDGLLFREDEAELILDVLGMAGLTAMFRKCQEIAGFAQEAELGNSSAAQAE